MLWLVGFALRVDATAPNILFLMADQLRFDALSSFPGSSARTPHLDGLTAEGALFTHHYSSTPICTPARAAILTGRSPWNHGMLGYGAVAPQYDHELIQTMEEAGYRTVVVGKNHFGCEASANHSFQELEIYDGLGSGMPTGKCFDDYDRWFQRVMPGDNPLKSGHLDWNTWRSGVYEYPEELHPPAWTGRVAVQQLEELAQGGEPFFSKVSFHRPHSPYDPPRRVLNETPSPRTGPARSSDVLDNGWRHCFARGTKDAWCGEVAEDEMAATRRAYLASVTFVDEKIGDVLAALSRLGLQNNTFVLFTSDHGDMQQDPSAVTCFAVCCQWAAWPPVLGL